MQKDCTDGIKLELEHIFTELNVLESIIKLTKDSCFEKENNSIYYDLTKDKMVEISNERNHYINLLSLAVEKVNTIRNIGEMLELGIYNSTPTIAAER